MNQLNFFSDYVGRKYGRKLYRIGIDLALGCPNRAGRFGPGCVYCAEDGNRARHLSRSLDLPGQVAAGVKFARERYGAEPPYIAYFQAFTSTFAPVGQLRDLYRQVLEAAPFAMAIIGTRPDALPPEVIAFLAELNEQYEVWVELGVQSANDSTLELIRRGHDFAAVERAAELLAASGLRTACHVIAGLPGEERADFIRTARKLAKLPFRAVKLHQLLTLRGTPLASPEFPVKPVGLNEYEYAKWAADFLRELPEEWLIMRLLAEAEERQIVTPKWWMGKGQFLEFFRTEFARDGIETPFAGVATADGSPTLYHPEFRQHFRSLAGADSETEKKFLEPARFRERVRSGKPVRLLDIGFGLGGNCAAAVEAGLEAGAELEILTLESDLRTLPAAQRLCKAGSLRHELIAALADSRVFRKGGVRVELAPGDARKTLTGLAGCFDVMFHDGFSPDCNPELWSFDFVRLLAEHLAPGGVIASYSSAYPYRGALLRAGFAVGESEPFGRKRGGTVAAFDPALLPAPLPEKERNIILRSTAGVAYRDAGLAATREQLFALREKLIARLRARGVPKWYRNP